ncbi:MAG: NADH:flavin oxidoreductase/NADH oxidase [Gammaproteobacteria bacterium]|nr:NADH:flavin oxidoreductase/NADH oxidase [Gammaproteobacteria bacterium]
MSALFAPVTIRGVTFPNRIAVSPLCMYSAIDGVAQPWHFAHLSTFARGKAGLIFSEAIAVEAIGRITPHCLGIWTEAQVDVLKPITAFIDEMDCVPAIQLSHAGRKASTAAPFLGGKPLVQDDPQAWPVVGPSAASAGPGFPVPHELSVAEIQRLVDTFALAAERSIRAGFRVIELHGAHGYLINSFLSPISNLREDAYGGDIHGRMRFALEVARATRAVVGEEMPLFFRISAVDGGEGGWTMDDSVILASELGKCGIDVVDCSSGGISGAPRFRSDDDGKPLNKDSARAPGFQVPYAERIRKETDVMTMAVGVIVDPHQAEEIIQNGRADFAALGREIMHDPFWPLHAAEALGVDPDFKMWPKQYGWAVDRRAQITALNQKDE